MRDVIVIAGFGEALAAPESIWSLVDAGFKAVVFTRRGRSAALRRSRYVKVHEISAPELDVSAARADLEALMAQCRVDHPGAALVVLPLDDCSLWLANQIPPSAGWCLAGAFGEGASLALDKATQIATARASGFKVPETLITAKREDLTTGVAAHFPIILRPSRAISPEGNRLRKGSNFICAGSAELGHATSAWQEKGELLVQPYLQGTGEGVFGFASAAGVVAWSGHRRLRMMNPHGSGSSACQSRTVSDEEKLKAGAFIRSSGWRGLFMIELLRDPAGDLWFVEFNGRTWGSMALSRRQGFEYPAWAVEQALDASFVPADLPAGKSGLICRNLGREIMHLLFVLRGPKSKAVQAWPSLGTTLRNVFGIGSRSSFYNWRQADWKVFFADAWETVRGQVFKRKTNPET